MEEVADVKAESIAEWIATDLVARSLKYYFKKFLLEFLDDNERSKYGQKIQHLGEGEYASYDFPAHASQSTPSRSRYRSSTSRTRPRSSPSSSARARAACSTCCPRS